MKMKKILITPRSFSRYGEHAVELLRNKGYEVIVNNTGKQHSYERFCELASDVEGIILGVDQVDSNMLENSKQLKVISRFGVGVDNIDLEKAKELGIEVKRAIGPNATSVAELTMGLFFTLARDIYSNIREVKEGQWNKTSGMELLNRTVGIVGLGAIGREVARIARGIGMNVIAYDPFVDKECDVEMKTFEELMEESDFVTLHMPLTHENKHIVNKQTLSLMKPSAFLVNTARGDLVNEEDLYQALTNGVIAGAAEDVFSVEPPAKDEKLLQLDNFLLCAHIASLTKNAEINTINLTVSNLLEILENN